MNNTLLKILAAVLALGAIAVAIIGIRLSQQPNTAAVPAVSSPASAPLVAVVVAARPIKAGRALTLADVSIKAVQGPPFMSYKQKEELMGKVALTDIPADTPLQPSQFLTGTMAAMLKPGERAIAIGVDEVAGVGGYVRPGDKVDLLAFAPGGGSSNTQPFAQVAVRGARVLSIGDLSQMDIERAHGTRADPTKEDEPPGPKNAQELKDFRSMLRSTVLAVPETEITRILLLSQNGALMRLALRPAVTPNVEPIVVGAAGVTPTHADERQTITLSQLAPAIARPEEQRKKTLRIVIQEGSAERTLLSEEPAIPQP